MTPTERKALFAAAVVRHSMYKYEAAQHLGASTNHIGLVLAGERVGSVELLAKIASFCSSTIATMFPDAVEHQAAQSQPARRSRRQKYGLS